MLSLRVRQVPAPCQKVEDVAAGSRSMPKSRGRDVAPIALAMRHKLPAVYAQREFVVAGGLMSYAADFSVQFRNAAGYVDRILKGEKPADLPVQAPTKYALVIN